MKKEKLLNEIELLFLEGLKCFKEKQKVNICLYDDKLTINKNLILPLNRIKNIYFTEETEIKQEDKSAIKRGILGFAIAGPIGAGIGAASGIGKKEVKNVVRFVIIDYINKDSNNSTLKFTIDSGWWGNYHEMVKDFIKETRKLIGLSEEINELEKIPDCPQEI